MNIIKTLWTIDMHTTGTPIRLIVSGMPPLLGDTVSEKMAYMHQHYDDLRLLLCRPPRGSESLVCAIIVPPGSSDADYGLFYVDANAYQPMCGAGTLAVAKALVETGMVPRTPPITTVRFETGAGLVKVMICEEPDGSIQVKMINAPAFALMRDITLDVDELGQVKMDIYFGGNFFTLVDTEQLGFEISAETIPRMMHDMKKIITAAKKQIQVAHPLNPQINYIDECLFIQDKPEADGGYLGQCIYAFDHFDISPCGTGTCSRVAQRYHRGLLKLGEPFMHKQAYGGKFIGRALAEVDVGGYPGVIPEITCSDVHMTGMGQLFLERDDRLYRGIEMK